MKITKQSRRDAKQLFRSALVNGLLDEGKARQVVSLVIARKPRGFQAIIEHFKRLVQLEQDRRRANVESAVALSPEQRAGLSASLECIYGKGLNVAFDQNAALIGGLRVRVGSDVYDGSVAARLKQLEEAF